MPKHETTLRNRKNSKKLPIFEKRQTPEDHILSIDDKFVPFSMSDTSTPNSIPDKTNTPFLSILSIKDIPAYQSPPKNARVSHAYDYYSVISDPLTSPTPSFAKFIAKKLVSHFASHLVTDLAFHQLSNLLSSLGVSPLAFIVFSLSLVRNVQATNSIALMDGFPLEGLDLCSPKARMIYCEQFYTVSAENTSLLTDPLIQGVTQLIADEQWSKSFNHYNFLFDLKEKLQCIDIEKLKSIFIENVLPLNTLNYLDHLNNLNNGTEFDQCFIEGQVQGNDWVYTLIRGLSGVSPEMCQTFKNVNPSYEISCMSHWNYNVHAISAFLITAGSTLFSFFIYFCTKGKINRQPDSRTHPDLIKVIADKSPIKITPPSKLEKLSARSRRSYTFDRNLDLIDRSSAPIDRSSDYIDRKSNIRTSDLLALRHRSTSLSPPRPFAFDKRSSVPPKGSFLTVPTPGSPKTGSPKPGSPKIGSPKPGSPKTGSPERGSLLSDKRNKATASLVDSSSPRVRIDSGSPKLIIDIPSPSSDADAQSPTLGIDPTTSKPDAYSHSPILYVDSTAPKPDADTYSPTLRIDPKAPKMSLATPATIDLSPLRRKRSIHSPHASPHQSPHPSPHPSPHQSLHPSHSFSEIPAEKYYAPLRNRNRNRNRRITLPIDQKSLGKKPQDQPILPDDSGLDSFSSPSHSHTISDSSSSQKNSFAMSPPSDSLVFPSAAESSILQKNNSDSLSPDGDSNSHSRVGDSHSHSRSQSRLQTHSHMHTQFILLKDGSGPTIDDLGPVRVVSGQISDVSVPSSDASAPITDISGPIGDISRPIRDISGPIRKDSDPPLLSSSYDDPKAPILISPGSPPPIKSISRTLGIRPSDSRPLSPHPSKSPPLASRPSDPHTLSPNSSKSRPSASRPSDSHPSTRPHAASNHADIPDASDAILRIPESTVSVIAFSPSASISSAHLTAQNLLVELSTHSMHPGSADVDASPLLDTPLEFGKKRALSTISENHEGLQKMLGSFKPVT